MAVGHFLVTALEWRNTEYLVTERQVLIRHGIFQPTLTTYSLHGLPHTIVEMHGPDIGNLMFKPREGQGYGPYPGYQTMWPYTPDYILGFLFVRDPPIQQLIASRRDSGDRRASDGTVPNVVHNISLTSRPGCSNITVVHRRIVGHV